MNISKHNIRIINEQHGVLLDENFINAVQFQLFLKMIQGCLELKNDLTFFNGIDFLIHIPFKILTDSIILTKLDSHTLAEHLITKSKIEALETK